jgi:hypothetical protein
MSLITEWLQRCRRAKRTPPLERFAELKSRLPDFKGSQTIVIKGLAAEICFPTI